MGKTIQTPLVHDAGRNEHTPMSPGAVLPVSVVPISATAGNMLKAEDEGLLVEKFPVVSSDKGNVLTPGSDGGALLDLRDVVSPASGNIIRTAKDGGLYAAATDISKDADNLLGYGKDKGISLSAGDILSNDRGNLLHVGPDNKLALTREDMAEVTVVSRDAGNLIQAGVADHGAYLDANGILSNDANNALSIGSDGRVILKKHDISTSAIVSEEGGNFLRASTLDGGAYLDASGVLSHDKDNLLAQGTDGKVVMTREALQIPPAVSTDDDNLLRVGVADSGAYLDSDSVLSNEAGNLLSVSPVDKRVMLRRDDLGIPEEVPTVSADDGNAIVAGSDGGSYFPYDFGMMSV